MPDLTVTLTDDQWAAYQAVNADASLDEVSDWLKHQLSEDYQRRLEGADIEVAGKTDATKAVARATKIATFEA